MDIRVAEGVYAEKIVHYHNKAIGGVSNRVAAAGGGLTAARCPAWYASTAGCAGIARTRCLVRCA